MLTLYQAFNKTLKLQQIVSAFRELTVLVAIRKNVKNSVYMVVSHGKRYAGNQWSAVMENGAQAGLQVDLISAALTFPEGA